MCRFEFRDLDSYIYSEEMSTIVAIAGHLMFRIVPQRVRLCKAVERIDPEIRCDWPWRSWRNAPISEASKMTEGAFERTVWG